MARLAGVDLPREKRMEIALTYIYGIGKTHAKETLAATGVSPVVIPLAQTAYPKDWRASPEFASQPEPNEAGAITVQVRIGRPDVYEFWLGESIKPGAELWVDGEMSGEVRHVLPDLMRQGVRASVVVADPPRAGFPPKALQALATLAPARIASAPSVNRP